MAALADSRIHVVYADAAFQKTVGANPLDADTRIPGAYAGRELGRRIAPALADFWHET